MTCEEFLQRHRRGDDDDAMGAHLHGCVLCRRLVAASPPTPTTALPQLLTAIEGDIAGESRGLGRLRALSTARRLGVGLALLACTVVTTLVATPRADLALYPQVRLASELTGLLAAAAVALALAMRGPHRPLPGSLAGVALAVGALPWLLPLAPVATAAAHPAALWSQAAACLLFGALLALPLMVWIWLSSRTQPPLGIGALLAGVAAGVLGVAALHLHCPITQQAHLALGHAPIPLLLAGAALLLRGWRRPAKPSMA